MRHIGPTHPSHAAFAGSGIYLDQRLDARLIETAATQPDELALVDAEHRLTWSELHERANASARQLHDLGVAPGTVATVILPNWWEAAVAIQGLLKLGAITNPVVPIYRDAELGFILQQAQPRAIITPHRHRNFDFVEMFQRLRASLEDPPVVIVVRPEGPLPPGFVEFEAIPSNACPVDNPTRPTDVCLLLYTSGTTSDPKGVLHNHQTLDKTASASARHCQLTAADTIFMPSPITHITGVLAAVLLPPLLGAPCVLMDEWDPQRARRIIETEQCRFCIGATPFLQGLLQTYEGTEPEDCSLTGFICGGADVPADLIRDARRDMGIWAARAYGSSEVPCHVMGGPSLDERTCAETDGIPLAEGSEARLHQAVDGVGELLLRAPQMFLGYLDADLNADAFSEDGFFFSGDLGEIGSRGEITIRGRQKDIIVRGGENISAKQVEDALYRHPSVQSVAVVAMPDPVLVERGCAFVVPEGPSPTLRMLVDHLEQAGLAKPKWPERLEVVAELPMTASGKVQKFKLRERIRDILAHEANTPPPDTDTTESPSGVST
ncbi:AMP-binding protein [Myxococcota bacterium]|nr:AMP-binding protein [Myxococcota bacterium]